MEDLPADWEAIREERYEELEIPPEAQTFVDRVKGEMAEALGQFHAFLARPKRDDTKHVSIRRPGGGSRGVFHVPKIPKAPERPAVHRLKTSLIRRWGILDLLDVLVEADRELDFYQYFETTGQRQVLAPAVARQRLLLVLFSLGNQSWAATDPCSGSAGL